MTQGLLTVTQNGKVVLKIVVGCNGYNINEIARLVKIEHDFSNPEPFYDMAEHVDFGCDACRVIMTKDEIYPPEMESEVTPLFRKTFNKPEFNPRWKHGTADYLHIIHK